MKKIQNFLSYGNAKSSEKRLIDAIAKAVEKTCESKKMSAHIEIQVTELEPGLNEIVIRLIEGESYKKLVQLIDKQIADDERGSGRIH